MVVPDHIFEVASNMWEPSDELERDEYKIEYVPSDFSDELMTKHSFNGTSSRTSQLKR